MSYDLHAFRVPPETSAASHYESGDADGDDAPPTEEQRAAMERLADALLAVDPSAERHDGETFNEIVASEAHAEPRWKFWKRR